MKVRRVLVPRYCAVIISALMSSLSFPALSADSDGASPKQDTLTVTSDGQSNAAENAWGPVGSVVAKRSATATKTDTPLRKTPQSITVVTREEMDLLGPQTLKDAFRYSADVMVDSRGSVSGFNSVNIRGFSQVGDNIYLDGLKLQSDSFTSFQVDPYMLERAELLRGPASVLYGLSDPSGIIALVSKRPTPETLREVQFKAGNHNLFQTGFDFGGAVDDDNKLTYRLTGVASDQDQQQTGEKAKRYSIAPSFTWRPSDKTQFTFLSSFLDEPDTGWFGYLPKEGTVTSGAGGKLPTSFNDGEPGYNKISRKQKLVGYAFDHQLNDSWTIRQNLRYGTVDMDYRTIFGSQISPFDPSQLTRGALNAKEHLSTFAVDTQAQHTFSTYAVDHTLLMGVDYRRTRNDVWQALGIASSLNLVNPVYGNTAVQYFGYRDQVDHLQQTGLYLQDQAEWNHWVFTLGGRYDWSEVDSVNRLTNNTAAGQDDNEFTWRGGLNYLFDNGISPYISYSESFLPTAGSDYTGKMFQASRAKQYEAGIKYIPDNQLISATLSVFQLTKDKNLSSDPEHILYSIQNGEQRSRGIELETKAALTENVDIIGSYSYTDAEYTKDTLYQGNRPAEIPKNMAALWGNYTFHETSLSGLTVGLGSRYIGSTEGDNANSFKVKPYTIWNAVIQYDLGRFSMPGSTIGLNVNNLFDKNYVAGCYATTACFYGAERQITATATLRF
ncbi:ferrichrome porin FhuA [Pantoea allii]|uniref:ferrichrome porin FhuA n=1 Tax=Pantoea allii TaxID=574096 RepID=UPI000A23217C|nr:ferrichrome porin FhuA [Pantoea allii]MBW1251712.1 ferrichrome porin FhuA [Pantoea allii]MBW1260309.1 ferrichrome porin FhuA [Pantoea allii]MBW1282906.1 ferrichrome porin FhuA [Pantoea allii]ORM89095.1 ferrichrome porin FhuA [Pantoea allii]PBJ99120.1 ferrichrome porin FhuA [Pantoea allii]